MIRRLIAVLVAAALAGCDDGSSSPSPGTATVPAPWQRTETRQPCDAFDLLRQPLFGDLHVHTRYSADATIYGTKTEPRDAYDFARGGEIAVSDADEAPTRRARLERRLDFAAVTDHSEFYGEVDVCTTPGSPVFDINMCRILRQVEPPSQQFLTTVQWLFPAGVVGPLPFHRFCSMAGVDCAAAKVSVWQEIQEAAEAAYDRSAACEFTSFIGYEHTASPGGRHLHRNVIFRNEQVPPYAASQVDTAAGGIPFGLWSFIEDACLNADSGCDALIIPHNSNLSAGQQFFDPADRATAQRRQDREPLVELHQQKGNSECRFDRLAGRGVGTEDELCAYEQLLYADQVPPSQPPPNIDVYPRRNLIRNALKDGLGFEHTLGANPFKYGFVGGTDTHNATAGNTEDVGWEGHEGANDATDARQIDAALDSNPGGLAAVWAEENSRDAIFAALRRRETYATSGHRPLVRFFGGDLTGVECGNADFLGQAYATGVPMGGDIGAPTDGAAPRFAVLAMKDPGTETRPGSDLQRVQIVKGWLDADGQPAERVYDVAGDANNGADVDPVTCEPRGSGASELCTVWTDPDFDPTQRAFYYARVLDNPTCRWSTRVCKANGVDPFSPDCAAQVAAADAAFADCCLTQENDPFVSPTTQERAWTSPIWYRPETIATVEGGVRFGGRGQDRLELTLTIGRWPAEVDPAQHDLVLTVSDDDTIAEHVIPAGALSSDGAGGFQLPDGAVPGIASATIAPLPDSGALLTLRAAPADLSNANRVDHFVEVALRIGDYRAAHVRLWRFDAASLTPATGA